eukprot:gnl/MRDRNA2_/MRDRNA2_62004_c0_seq1.p1 gnl/MRDRNA2_/MRDRNA2_62004_c0~~gnl/MRDRNA2_/MRDRNA2_62004_c0_seq1.p1  ORF type:complete len:440 (+),score=99.10 gnl/MRDRNA2_/MRDRNA2_62004_c0_seq1:74-1321(+)
MSLVHRESPRLKELKNKLIRFIEEDVEPGTEVFHQQQKTMPGSPWVSPPILEELKAKAKTLGLWNVWMPKGYPEGPGLTNFEYAQLAEIMGGCHLASEACNCSAPDTGNMETIAKYGTDAHKEQWLKPLMEGKIRSAFLMTEPAVASSDATNIQTEIRREGDEYVINGTKWWSSGAMDPRCKIYVVMGKTDTGADMHKQQSMVLVPADTPGVHVKRFLSVFGYDDSPHGHAEVELRDVRVPVSNVLLGEGRGFEIAQGRLGPGRIHHCMRAIGVAEAAQKLMLKRVTERRAFSRKLVEYHTIQQDIAENRIEIEQARLMTLYAAAMIDAAGDAKGARQQIAMIKVSVPRMALKVVDRAMQAHGGAGVSQDFPLAHMWALLRTLRLADGPDEVHLRTIFALEAKQMMKTLKQASKL